MLISSETQSLKWSLPSFDTSFDNYFIYLNMLYGKSEVPCEPIHRAISLPTLIWVRPLTIALLFDALRRYHQVAAETDQIVFTCLVRRITALLLYFKFVDTVSQTK